MHTITTETLFDKTDGIPELRGRLERIRENFEQEEERQHKESYSLGYKDGWRDGRNPLNNPPRQITDEELAQLSERKTVHEWLNALSIPTEEAGKEICLLRRLRIACDELAAIRRATPTPTARTEAHGSSGENLA